MMCGLYDPAATSRWSESTAMSRTMCRLENGESVERRWQLDTTSTSGDEKAKWQSGTPTPSFGLACSISRYSDILGKKHV